MTRHQSHIRLALYLVVAGAGFLNASQTWLNIVGPRGLLLTGFVGALGLAWRAYVDTSDGDSKLQSGAVPLLSAQLAEPGPTDFFYPNATNDVATAPEAPKPEEATSEHHDS